MGRFCSAVLVSVAAASCLTSVALVGIAFSTDNWTHVAVQRPLSLEDDEPQQRRDEPQYFDRVEGIFRICFPDSERPRSSMLYLNPVDEWCINKSYFMDALAQGGLVPPRLTFNAQVWLHLSRSCVACFCLFFMFTGIACTTGLLACWNASGHHLVSTSILMLAASLCGASAMGFWHGAQFYELNRVFDQRLAFFMTWPEALRHASSFHIGWSYIVAWSGILSCLVSSVAFSLGAIAIRRAQRQEEAVLKLRQRYPQYWGMQTLSLRRPLSAQGSYYSAGYPQQDDNYKNVVKELEGATGSLHKFSQASYSN